MTRATPTRRAILSGSAATLLGLAEGPAAAQSGPGTVRFHAACRDLGGFDPLRHGLVAALADRLDAQEVEAVARYGASLPDGELLRRVLHALYRGVLPAASGDHVDRLGYAEALMFAAISDRLNLPSYCGGLPGYWQADPTT